MVLSRAARQALKEGMLFRRRESLELGTERYSLQSRLQICRHSRGHNHRAHFNTKILASIRHTDRLHNLHKDEIHTLHIYKLQNRILQLYPYPGHWKRWQSARYSRQLRTPHTSLPCKGPLISSPTPSMIPRPRKVKIHNKSLHGNNR